MLYYTPSSCTTVFFLRRLPLSSDMFDAPPDCFDILSFHALRFPSITLQNKTPATVLTAVARIAGPTIAVRFTLPYWLRYATTFIGINCKDEIFRIRNTHISLLAVPFGTAGKCPDMPPAALRSSSRFLSSSIAFSPPCVKLMILKN